MLLAPGSFAPLFLGLPALRPRRGVWDPRLAALLPRRGVTDTALVLLVLRDGNGLTSSVDVAAAAVPCAETERLLRGLPRPRLPRLDD